MHFKTVIATIATAMILSMVMQYASVMTVVSMTKRNTQRVVNNYITTNEIEIYNSIKNKHDFTESIDTDIFKDAFVDECVFNKADNEYVHTNRDGEIVYKITDLDVSLNGSGVGQSSLEADANGLDVEITYTISYPLSFAREHLSVDIPIKIESTHRFNN